MSSVGIYSQKTCYTMRKIMSRTNIDLNNKLVEDGLKLTNCKSKKELVNLALQELVNRKKRKRILELEGKIDWQGNLEKLRESRI